MKTSIYWSSRTKKTENQIL